MGTKNNPGRFDCYAAAEPDEPMFVLLGRDRHAELLVRCWALIREHQGEPDESVAEARKAATAMRNWAEVHNRPALKPGVVARVLACIAKQFADEKREPSLEL